MSTRPKIDFQELKARVSLEQVMQLLQLNLKRSAGQFRGACPVHGGNDRTFVVTPNKGFYCWSVKEGGDQIAMYAHVRECNNYDAAVALSTHFRVSSPAPPAVEETPAGGGMNRLDYLSTDHPVIEALGLTPEVCEAIGIGYTGNNGTMKGRVVFPLIARNGDLVGYLGLATRADQTPLLKFPDNLAERCGIEFPEEDPPEKRSADDMRKLLRVV